MGELVLGKDHRGWNEREEGLGNGLGQYCVSQEKVLPTGLLVYFWVVGDCLLILRAKFQVEFKQIRLNANQ